MAPQQGQSAGDKAKKRPAEASLTSSTTKKPKTADGNIHRANKSTPAPQKSGAEKNSAQKDRQNQQVSNKGKGSANQNNGRQSNGRDSNRPSFKDIRAIASQPSDAALKDGELDVQAFLNARGFEIKALDESMRRTRVSKSSRAFQRVPFVMRRRAAAHNHKKVPKRLQRRAKREMDQDNTPTVNSRTRKPKTTRSRLRAETALRLGKLAERKKRQKLLKKGQDGRLDQVTVQTRLARPKIKRNVQNNPVITARKFRKRQLNKTWLPTHLWHTKRAKMTAPKDPLWRFAIPLTPNQKCYRPTHRTLREKGAMAWDMSYMSTISLCGIERSATQVLKSLGLTAESFWNERGEKWRSGALHWNGTLTRMKDNVLKTIGPATILWNPQSQSEAAGLEAEKKPMRKLLIRVHPSVFLETFNELLRLAKGLTPRPYVEDLRYEIGSIEVTGPDSTEALLGVLKPYHREPSTEHPHATKWESLAGVSPSVLPAGSLLAFSVVDPRLHYPPRRVEVPKTASQTQQTSSSWHQDLIPKPSPLFDRDARFKASRLPSQKSLNRRRANKSPGALLEPTQQDPEIDIILLSSRQADAPGKWTLLLPWKCVLPVWYALMHCPLSSGGNPLFGGLQELQQAEFEQGRPWFPGDFPATDAGMAWELEQREIRKKSWDRMPNGKRVNYETLDLGAGRKGEIGQGWNCDYESLLDLNAKTTDGERPDVVMAGQDESAKGAMNQESGNISGSVHALSLLTHFSKSALNARLSVKEDHPPTAALVTARVKLLGRGVPGPCARIYRLPAAEAITSTQAEVPATNPPLAKSSGLPSNLGEQWLATLPNTKKQASSKHGLKHNASMNLDLETRKRLLAQELTAPHQSGCEGINGHSLCPDAEDLIGFVTTGSFNLKDGQAEAIASLSVDKTVTELKRHKSKEDRAARLCVVRNAGQSIGWIARWELV